MQVVLSTEPTAPLYQKEQQYYLMNTFVQQWTQKYSEHQFYIIIYGGRKESQTTTDANLHFVDLNVSATFPLYRWRCRNKLASFIKKINADIFLCFNGTLFPKKKFSQYGLISQPLSRRLELKSAAGFIALSQLVKQKLKEQYKLSGENILVVYGGSNTLLSVDEDEKPFIKEQYTQGREFFLISMNDVPQDHIIQLLKAFSIFKKRQKTSMQLVLTGKVEDKESFEALIKTYKYKEEIVVLHAITREEKTKLSASAYATVIMKPAEANLLSELDIIATGSPVLTANYSILKEGSSDTALYFDSTDINDIADKLMLIYKDETLRSQMIERGNRLTKELTWPATAEAVWQFISKK